MYIQRTIENRIKSKLFKGKAILIFGARQVGKSTLLNHLLQSFDQKILLLDGDDTLIYGYFENPSPANLKKLIGNNKIIAIDEAQRLPNIGLNIKIMVDKFPDIQVIATGSSAFELTDKTQESLAGRKYEFYLPQFSFQELLEATDFITERKNLENRLIYGSYPEVVLNPAEAEDYLYELLNSILYKDIFSIKSLRKPEVLTKLLKALALQTGSEVSYNELAGLTGSDKETIERYISILEKTFIIFRLPALSRNPRREIKRSRKIFFWDLGLRNTIINNFLPLDKRNDVGQLWENYLVAERRKILMNNFIRVNTYFWRNINGAEIDYIEEINGEYAGYEFKWNPKRSIRKSQMFMDTYNADIEKVSSDNYDEFLLKGV